MGIPVMIMGESGSGKTTSIEQLDEKRTFFFNIVGKPLPFKKKFTNTLNRPSYQTLYRILKENQFDTYVIDDSQYLMAFELFDKVHVKNYDKFVEIAVSFRKLIDTALMGTHDNTIVYFLHHTENTDSGVKAKTIGKMLDEKLTVEGLFTIVLRTYIDKGSYYFVTKSNGRDTCKSPRDMFQDIIENDLSLVDSTIRTFYELEPPLVCEVCGELIKKTQKSTAAEAAAATEKEFGKKMCMRCYKDERNKRKEAADIPDGSPSENTEGV